MRKYAIILLSLALITSFSSHSNAAAKKFKNCTELNKVYVGGISEKKSSANKNKAGVPQVSKNAPTVSAKIYKENKGLDRDKDGIACEN